MGFWEYIQNKAIKGMRSLGLNIQGDSCMPK